ncbi:MAG: hypothetical protein ACR2QA_12395 [Solirubrobacteraceae bacterium]
MPTTKPRYTVTDTGDLAEMLDVAQRRWPQEQDRRRLLLALAAAGRDAIAPKTEIAERSVRREPQREALARAHHLVDRDGLLSDAAWR